MADNIGKADPAGISSGMGTGYAQVWGGEGGMRGVEYQLSQKKQREAEKKAQEAAAAKAFDDSLDTINKINSNGYISHIQYLTDKKDVLRNDMINKYLSGKKSGKNYDPNTDPELQHMISSYQSDIETSKQVQDYAKILHPIYNNKDSQKNFTDESKLRVDEFLNMMPNEQREYIKQNGNFPALEPKKEVVDPEKLFSEMGQHLGKVSTKKESQVADGTQTNVFEGVPDAKKRDGVTTIIQAGLKGTDPKAVQWVTEVEGDLIKNNPEYRLAKANGDVDKADKIFQEEAMAQGLKRMGKYMGSKSESTLQGATGSGDGKKKLSASDVQLDIPITRKVKVSGFDENGKPMAPKTVIEKAKFGVTLPSDITLNVPATSDVLDSQTGKALMDSDGKQPYTGQLDVSGGGKVLSVPITKNGKTQLVPMIFTTASLVKEDGTTIKKEVQIPLSQVRGEKVLENSSEALNELERKTDEYNSGGKKSSSDYSNISTVKDSSGKSVKAGVRDGKWYNIETGKPL